MDKTYCGVTSIAVRILINESDATFKGTYPQPMVQVLMHGIDLVAA